MKSKGDPSRASDIMLANAAKKKRPAGLVKTRAVKVVSSENVTES